MPVVRRACDRQLSQSETDQTIERQYVDAVHGDQNGVAEFSDRQTSGRDDIRARGVIQVLTGFNPRLFHGDNRFRHRPLS